MRFFVVATDYNGALACDGRPDAEALPNALESVKTACDIVR
jgi:hypothetical protein